MTNPLTIYNYTTYCQDSTTPPIYKRLKTIIKTIPDDELLESLKTYYAGRNGYTYKILWQTYVAMVVLNLQSFAALIRTLENNPFIALACGITGSDAIPSKFAYSRFMRKLQIKHNEVLVRDIMRKLTRKCYEIMPDFGKSVAIDSTDLKAWSNGSKERKTDPDAGWSVKSDSNGKRKFVWGYKLHLLIDTTHEIPIAANITKGNVNDVRHATPLLAQARKTYGKFRPEYIICDAGYSSDRLRHLFKKQYHSQAIIKARKIDKAIADETAEWQQIFHRRTSVERVFERPDRFTF